MVKIWDVVGEPGQYRVVSKPFSHLGPTFSPDGNLLAQCVGGGFQASQVHVCHVDTGRVVANLEHPPSSLLALAFSSDGTRIATASKRRKQDSCEVRLWDLKSQQEVGVIAGFTDSITQLAFSPGGRLLATVVQRVYRNTFKRTGEVKFWDVKTYKEQQSFPGLAMEFNPNGANMAVLGNDNSLALFDVGQARG